MGTANGLFIDDYRKDSFWGIKIQIAIQKSKLNDSNS